jgi:peptidoglycan/xylan/chitin deacetylase (PgdA/CDA1 family)
MKQSTIISKIPIKEKIMALTFDDGFYPGDALAILDILKQNNVKCTFFLTGSVADIKKELVTQIVMDGHEIGNHSYTHPDFTSLTVEQIQQQIINTEKSLVAASGNILIKPLFRPPYGYYNADVLGVVESTGYPWTMMWTIDTLDWSGTSSNDILSNVLRNHEPGAIVLMHLTEKTNTIEALPKMIKYLRFQGYELTTLSTLLSMVYQELTSISYVVKLGDTLWKISNYFKVSLNEIVKLNNIENPDLIYVGQELIMPLKDIELTHYKVKPGDILLEICERFDTTIETISKINNINNPDLIYVDQILIIPPRQ